MHWAIGGLLLATLHGPEQVDVSTRFDGGIPTPVQERLSAVAVATVESGQPSVKACAQPCSTDAYRLELSVTQEARDYTVSARLEASDGTVLEESERVCKICRYDELEPTMVEAVQAVATAFEEEEPQTGTLSVVSSPSGASVFVDGQPAGPTPLEMSLPPGTHEIRVHADGYRERTETASVSSGAVARQSFELSKEPRISPRVEEGLGWAAVAVGGAALISGAVLLVFDERDFGRECSGTNVDADGDCRLLYDTLGVGVGLLAGGAVVGASGGVVVWHGRKRRGSVPGPHATFGPSGIRGRF